MSGEPENSAKNATIEVACLKCNVLSIREARQRSALVALEITAHHLTSQHFEAITSQRVSYASDNLKQFFGEGGRDEHTVLVMWDEFIGSSNQTVQQQTRVSFCVFIKWSVR